MDLEESPFAILGLAPWSDREEIARAAEDAILDGRHPEAEVKRAQQRLTVSRPRLEAEAAWPIGVDAPRLRENLDAFSRSPSELPAMWRELSGLSKANLAAHVCARLAIAGVPVIPPAEAEERYYAALEAPGIAA